MNYAEKKKKENEERKDFRRTSQSAGSGNMNVNGQTLAEWRSGKPASTVTEVPDGETRNIYGQTLEEWRKMRNDGGSLSDYDKWKGQSEQLLREYDSYSHSGRYQSEDDYEDYAKKIENQLKNTITLKNKYEDKTDEINDIVERLSRMSEDNEEGRTYFSQWADDESYQQYLQQKERTEQIETPEKSEDFEKYAKYIEPEGFWNRMFRDGDYEYINDTKHNPKYLANGNGETTQAAKGYDYLTEEERKKYNYLYNKMGKKEAKKYLDSLNLTSRETEEREREKQQILREAEELVNAPDFEENSKYVYSKGEGWLDHEDSDYEYINDAESEYKRVHALNPKMDLVSEQGKKGYAYIKEDERLKYNYIYRTQGKKEAKKYLNALNLTKRMTEDYLKYDKEMAEEHPILASVESVISNVTHAGSGITDDIGKVLRGEEIDTYSYGHLSYNSNQEIRTTVSEGIDNSVGEFFYQTGMSMADFITTSVITGPLEGLGISANVAASLIMGSSAATAGVVEAKKRGVSDGDAVLTGILQGAAEVIFEKISLEQLKMFGQVPAKTVKEVVKNILKGTFTEGTEEVFTSIANVLTDRLVNGGLSEYETNIQTYIKQGMSEEEARNQGKKDFVKQLGLDFLGGGLSGGIMSGAVSGMAYHFDKDANVVEVGQEENTEVAPAQPDVRENESTKAQTAKESINTILEYGEASEAIADEIANNEAMTMALEETTGLKIVGKTKEQKRNAVREAVRFYGERNGNTTVQGTKAQQTAKIGARANVNGTDVKIIGIQSKNGYEPKFKASDGNTYDMDVVNFADDNTKKVYSDALSLSLTANDKVANVFLDNYQPEYSPAVYIWGFDRMYKAGRSGIPLDSSLQSMDYAVEKTDQAVMTTAWDLGAKERELENSTIAVKKVKQERKGKGEFKDKTRQDSPVAEIERLVANRTGINIERRAGIEHDANGMFVPSTMKMLLSENAENEYTALIHELGEFGLAYDRNGMKELQEAVVRYWVEKDGIRGVEDIDMLVERYQQRYAEVAGSETKAQALDEIVNDALGGLFSTDTGVDEFIEWLQDSDYSKKQKKTIVQRIVDTIDSIIEWLKEVVKDGKLTKAAERMVNAEEQRAKELRKKFLEVLDTALENANTTGEYETDASAKYSMEYEQSQDSEMTEFVQNVLEGKVPPKAYYTISTDIPIRLAEEIEKVVGFSVKGYGNEIDKGQIEHIWKRHGENGTQDNSLKNISDIAKMGYVVDEFDQVREGKGGKKYKNRDGSAAKHVEIQKKIGDSYYYVVEAVPDSKIRKLKVVSAYINKKDTFSGELVPDGPKRYVQNDSQSNVPNSSIANDSKKVNGKFSLQDSYENLRQTNENLLRENDTYKRIIDSLEKCLDIKKNISVSKESAAKVAKKLYRKYGSNTDLADFTERVTALFQSGEKSKGNFQFVAEQIMRPVLEESKNNVEIPDYAKGVLNDIKSTTIRMSEDQKNEAKYHYGTYNDFRRSLFGRAKLSDQGTSLDILWKQWSETYPELFDADISPVDQPMKLADIISSLKEDYINDYGFNLNEAVSYAAVDLMNEYMSLPEVKLLVESKASAEFRSQYWQLTNVLKKEYQAKYENQIKELKRTHRDRINKMQEKNREQLLRQQAKFKERTTETRATRVERQDKAKYKDSIIKSTKSITRMLEQNTDKQHVPEVLKTTTVRFLKTMDFLKDGWATQNTMQLQHRLDALCRDFSAVEEKEMDSFVQDLDPNFVPQLRALSATLEASDDVKKIQDMDSSQLKDLAYLVGTLKRTISMTNKLIGNERYEHISDLGNSSIEYLSSKRTKRKHTKYVKMMDDLLNMDQLDSFAYFEQLGEGASSIHQEIRDGYNERVWKIKDAQDYMQNVIGDTKIKDWTGKNAELHEFTAGGKRFSMTTGQLMSLYELSKRPQAMGHLFKKGTKGVEVRAGGFMIDSRGAAKGQIETEYSVKVSRSELQTMLSALTPEQKRIADQMQRYMAENCAEWGNEVSMTMYGYKKFGDKNYWPIKTNENHTPTSDKNSGKDNTSLYAIRNQGMTKSTVDNADNPIIIGDAFDVFTEHVVNMANYNAFTIPLSDAMKWYNYRGITEDGEITGTIKEELQRTYGEGAKQYFMRLIKDINGESHKGIESEISNSLMSKYKAAAVGANLRVVVQQPTAIMRASAVMDPKYLAEGIAAGSAVKEMHQHSAIALWKSWGYFETGIGQSMKQVITGEASMTEKIMEKSMTLAGKADDITWGVIWNAVKAEVRDRNQTETMSKEEFMELASKRFDEVIDKTQVVDTVLHRSQIMRNKNGVVKMATAFMAEPTKSYNLIRSAIAEVYNHPSSETRTNLMRQLVTFAATGIITALVASISDILRDDDEELSIQEKYLEHFEANIADNLNPINMVPYFKELPSLWEGWDSSRMDMEGISSLISGVQQAYKFVNGESKKTPYGVIKGILRGVSQVSGLPMYNAMRDCESIAEQFMFAPIDENKPTNKTIRIRLMKAKMEGNEKQLKKYLKWYEGEYQEKIEEGKSSKEAAAAIKAGITREFKKIYQNSTTAEKIEIKQLLLKISVGGKQLYKDQDWSEWEKEEKEEKE